MSRIGQKPVKVPSGVKVAVDGSKVVVEGKLGKLQQAIRPEISVAVEGDQVIVGRESEDREVRAFHGLTRSLINNMIQLFH